jgi:uncharacterized membrane protein YqaE (UPF0057 family)
MIWLSRVYGSFLCAERWGVDAKFSLFLLLDLRFLGAELAPRSYSSLSVFLPGLDVFLNGFLSDFLLVSIMSFLSLVGEIHALEVLLSVLNLFKQLFAHVGNLKLHAFFWKRLESLTLASEVVFLPLTLNTFFGLSHHSLVHATLLRVH